MAMSSLTTAGCPADALPYPDAPEAASTHGRTSVADSPVQPTKQATINDESGNFENLDCLMAKLQALTKPDSTGPAAAPVEVAVASPCKHVKPNVVDLGKSGLPEAAMTELHGLPDEKLLREFQQRALLRTRRSKRLTEPGLKEKLVAIQSAHQGVGHEAGDDVGVRNEGCQEFEAGDIPDMLHDHTAHLITSCYETGGGKIFGHRYSLGKTDQHPNEDKLCAHSPSASDPHCNHPAASVVKGQSIAYTESQNQHSSQRNALLADARRSFLFLREKYMNEADRAPAKTRYRSQYRGELLACSMRSAGRSAETPTKRKAKACSADSPQKAEAVAAPEAEAAAYKLGGATPSPKKRRITSKSSATLPPSSNQSPWKEEASMVPREVSMGNGVGVVSKKCRVTSKQPSLE